MEKSRRRRVRDSTVSGLRSILHLRSPRPSSREEDRMDDRTSHSDIPLESRPEATVESNPPVDLAPVVATTYTAPDPPLVAKEPADSEVTIESEALVNTDTSVFTEAPAIDSPIDPEAPVDHPVLVDVDVPIPIDTEIDAEVSIDTNRVAQTEEHVEAQVLVDIDVPIDLEAVAHTEIPVNTEIPSIAGVLFDSEASVDTTPLVKSTAPAALRAPVTPRASFVTLDMSGNPPETPADVPKPSQVAPIKQIYNKINELFGNSRNDIFQMEFPARLLEEGNYLYSGADTINAQQVKPPAVAEAEFRLSNDMYDISNLVGGANGQKLSEQYREVLFSLIPSRTAEATQTELDLKRDQAKIIAWLEEEVDNYDPPSTDMLKGIPSDLGLRIGKPPQKYSDDAPNTVKLLRDPQKSPKIPRIDLYQKLLDIYESERARWVQYKLDARPLDFSKQNEVDAYDRLLTTYAPVVDAKLEALWALLVIRGQLHRVREYVSRIDIESASEMLLKAKESLRASVVRSIDDSEDVYPVVFTPSNWAKYLSTNFQPEDLLNDPGVLRNKLFDAEKNRAALVRRKNTILAGQQDIKALETAEATARKAFSDSQTALTKGYGDTAIRLIQLYFDAKAKNAENKNAAVKDMDKSQGLGELNGMMAGGGQPPLTPAQFDKLVELQDKCLTNQDTMQKASETFIRAKLALEEAKATDGKFLLSAIEDQIASLSLDIDYYQRVLGSADNPTGVEIKRSGTDTSTAPTGPVAPPKNVQLPNQSGEGASVWQEIVLSYVHNESADSKMSSTSVSHTSWQVGAWFFSASGSSDESESSASAAHNSSNTDIEIGFRVMKVSIQRPWMNAAILAQTKDFFRNSSTPISSGSPAEIKNGLFDRAGDDTDSAGGLLPSFPTSFVIAKDVHIVFKSTTTFDSSFRNSVEKSSSSGGGFLCFSVNKSSASSDHREGAVVTSDANTLSIKIAAPQIIGWMSELTPRDESQSQYAQLPAEEFKINAKPAETTV